ncbi:MAG: Uroporphyrinogen decarboxylase [Thermoproteota archaeon]|nr:Uroporphyrinogen decarboxylase [Thermoproteota archaeon]
MSKFEKIKAVMRGAVLDETPVSLWRHFPGDDLKADSLYEKHINLQKRFNFDLVKFSAGGGYNTIAFGGDVEYVGAIDGSTRTKRYVVNSVKDWENLEVLDVQEGIFGEMLKAVKLFAKGSKGEVPFVETMFSPLTICRQIAGDRVVSDLRMKPEILHKALGVISKTEVEFAKAALDSGANGIFFATQMATFNMLSEDEYRSFGMKYDLPVLKAVEGKAFFNILHIHGFNTMFNLLIDNYPVSGVNWHVHRTEPTLKEAFSKFKGVLLGGINEVETMTRGSTRDVEKEVVGSISETDGSRIIVAPGCVVPLVVTEDKWDAVIRATRTYKKKTS